MSGSVLQVAVGVKVAAIRRRGPERNGEMTNSVPSPRLTIRTSSLILVCVPPSSAESWIQHPKQARSQRTLEALLDAAEGLLQTRAFHELRVQEIVERAGSSSGSFYARFADKRALLHALHERFVARVRGDLAAGMPEGMGRAVDRDMLVRHVVATSVETHRRHRGILRAALMESMHDPRFAERALALGTDAAQVLAARLSECQHGPAVDARSVAMALRLVTAALDQQLLIDPDGTFGDLDADALVAWLARVFTCAVDGQDGRIA